MIPFGITNLVLYAASALPFCQKVVPKSGHMFPCAVCITAAEFGNAILSFHHADPLPDGLVVVL